MGIDDEVRFTDGETSTEDEGNRRQSSIRESIQTRTSMTESIKPDNADERLPRATACRLLKKSKIRKYLALAAFDLAMLNFSPAILSKRLQNMGVSENLNGIFFALPFIYPIFSAGLFLKLQK